jgi:hypothetical protein
MREEDLTKRREMYMKAMCGRKQQNLSRRDAEGSSRTYQGDVRKEAAELIKVKTQLTGPDINVFGRGRR